MRRRGLVGRQRRVFTRDVTRDGHGEEVEEVEPKAAVPKPLRNRPSSTKMLARLPASSVKNLGAFAGQRLSQGARPALVRSPLPVPLVLGSMSRTSSASASPRRAPALPLHRCVLCPLLQCPGFEFSNAIQSFSSRASLATATLIAVGSAAWYTHLYGTLPFVDEVHATSPAEEGLHPPKYPWPHSGFFDSFDHARCVALLSLSFTSL